MMKIYIFIQSFKMCMFRLQTSVLMNVTVLNVLRHNVNKHSCYVFPLPSLH